MAVDSGTHFSSELLERAPSAPEERIPLYSAVLVGSMCLDLCLFRTIVSDRLLARRSSLLRCRFQSPIIQATEQNPNPRRLSQMLFSRLFRSTPVGLFELTALCLGEAVGASGEISQPIWVADLIKNAWLSRSQVALLASGELFAISLGAFAVSVFGGRVSLRVLVAAAGSLVVLSNALAILPLAKALIIGRLLSGVGMGILLGSVCGAAARRSDAQRVLARMQLTTLLVASALYFASPTLIARYDAAGIFGVIAAIASLEIAFAIVGLSALSNDSLKPRLVTRSSVLAPFLACLGMASIAGAFTTIWTYIVTVGASLGLSAVTVGNTLGFVQPLAILAPVLSSILGERLGLFWPLLCGLFVVAVDALFLVTAASPFRFAVCSAVFVFAATFYVPYAMALLGRLDLSGRFASATPIAFLLGASVGPFLGGKFIDAPTFQSLGTVAACLAFSAIALFVVAVRYSNSVRSNS